MQMQRCEGFPQTTSKEAGPAYYMAEFELTDPEGIRPYSAGVAASFEPFGGRFIVRGSQIAALEGDRPKGRLVDCLRQRGKGAGLVQFRRVPKAETNPAEVWQLPNLHR